MNNNGRTAKLSPEVLDRTPPCDLDAEVGVIGSVIIDPSVLDEIAGTVRPADFHDHRNRALFGHFIAMHHAGDAIDVTLLVNRLKANGDFEQCGGGAYIAEILHNVPVAAHAVHYAKIVREKATLRALADIGTDLLRDAKGNQATAGALIRRVHSELESTADGATQDRYPQLTCRELDSASFSLDYIIDHAMVEGQPLIVAGGKKSLKTSIILDAGISLAMAKPFLGEMEVERAVSVGVMSAESGMATIQETARRIADAKGLCLSDVGLLVFTDRVPRLDDPKHHDLLDRFITDNALEVLFLDPAYMAMPGGDAGNLFVQGALLRGVTELCQKRGCTLVLVHHCRKNVANAYTPPELEDIAWAGFQEWCRQWWLVGRREKYEPGSGEHRLWLNIGGSAGHSALWAVNVSEGVYGRPGGRYWSVETLHAADAREDAQKRRRETKEAAKEKQAEEQLGSDRQAIVNTMVKFPAGETKSVIRDTSGVRSNRFTVALGQLLANGEVVDCIVSKRGGTANYQGYKLAE